MPVEQLEGGTLVVTGNSISTYRLLALKHALKLETLGMKRRGGSVLSVIKKEFGLKGTKAQVLVSFIELLKSNGIN